MPSVPTCLSRLSGVSLSPRVAHFSSFPDADEGPCLAVYTLSFLTGWPTAALTYYVLCRIWPLPIPTDEEILEVPAALSGANKVVVSAPSDGLGHHHAGADVLSLGEGEDEKDEKSDDHDNDRVRGMVEIV